MGTDFSNAMWPTGGTKANATTSAAGKGAAGAAAGMNPYAMAAMVGLDVISNIQQQKLAAAQEREAAQRKVGSDMQNALAKLAGIGQSLGL